MSKGLLMTALRSWLGKGIALGIVAVAGLAQAEGSRAAFYPAAQCAAFWQGRWDYAHESPYLDEDATDLDRAAAFRAVAIRLNEESAPEIDAFIAEQRPLMVMLFDAMIYYGDGTSRDLHDRLLETCERFGAGQPETADLP